MTNIEKGYDLVTAIMVFQFIENIEATLEKIVSSIRNGGLLGFVIFNQDFIDKNKGRDKLFENHDNVLFMMPLNNIKIPIFERPSDFYRKCLEKLDCKLVFYDSPPFTKEFLEKYPTSDDTTSSEFQVMVFQKSGNYL